MRDDVRRIRRWDHILILLLLGEVEYLKTSFWEVFRQAKSL